MGWFLTAVVISLLSSLVSGAVLMVVFSVLNSGVSESIPAFGYWQSVLIAIALSIIGSIMRGSSSSD